MVRIAHAMCALASAVLLASCHQPPDYKSRYTAPATPSVSVNTSNAPGPGSLGIALRTEIDAALDATAWPDLEPSMDAVINGPEVPPDIEACGTGSLPPERCTWGAPDAKIRTVLVGDSIAMSYAAAFREIALSSGGRIQVHLSALPGCAFIDDLLLDDDQALVAACPARRQQALDFISSTRPDILFIAHAYGLKYLTSGPELTPGKWADSLERSVRRAGSSRVVLLAAPPAEKDIRECFPEPGSSPQKCASLVNRRWHSMANAERGLADTVGWTWMDSRPWFCADGKICPTFVGNVPTKPDFANITASYATKIAPVMFEALQRAGVL